MGVTTNNERVERKPGRFEQEKRTAEEQKHLPEASWPVPKEGAESKDGGDAESSVREENVAEPLAKYDVPESDRRACCLGNPERGQRYERRQIGRCERAVHEWAQGSPRSRRHSHRAVRRVRHRASVAFTAVNGVARRLARRIQSSGRDDGGDRDGACRAYTSVAIPWAHAKPRSVTRRRSVR